MTDSKFPDGCWLWTPKSKRTASLTVEVPMPHHRRQPRALEGAPEQLHEGDGAVTPAGATQGHGQIGLTFPLIEGQEEVEEILDLGEKGAALLEGHHERLHRGITAVEALEAVHEVGVREEAHVEHEVGVVGGAVLEAKRHQGDGEGVPGPLGAVTLDEPLLELVHGQSRGVDDAVGAFPEIAESPALRADAFEHAPLPGQGMAAPR